ncbi:MAG: FAD/NAD(P)-binding protein [Bacteroidia bacterium]|nr:FAD/NAD(P)-binding protein [Bacteroidia bacterium]
MNVAIIGSGLTGTLAAIYLKKSNADTNVILFEKSADKTLRGIPYSHQLEYQPLNVNTKGMTLFDDNPLHFFNWWKQNHTRYPEFKNIVPKEGDFVQRNIYGDYLTETFENMNQSVSKPVKIVNGEVIDILETGNSDYKIQLADGGIFEADKVLFALGNFPPSDPTFVRTSAIADDPAYISHPWLDNAIDDLPKDASVLFVGAGLTMVDLSVSLKKRGATGKFYVVSRRGLLPRPHAETAPYTLKCVDKKYDTALELFRAIRKEAKEAVSNGIDWRSVIDAIRPYTQTLWLNLPEHEKRRFLSHIRPYWDVLRHRMPQESFRQISGLQESGQMELLAGRICNIKRTSADNLEVTICPRNQTELVKINVSRIINCTGPQSDYRKLNTPLVTNLLNKGWFTTDEQSLGLKTDIKGAIIDTAGNSNRKFYTAGPPCKGTLWECTALRDIRSQLNQLIPVIAN